MKALCSQHSPESAALTASPKSGCPCGALEVFNAEMVHNFILRIHNQTVKAFLARVRGRGFQLKGPPL
jgi:hypothetical protein